MAVRVDLNISLDGYATTEGGTAENPMGTDWNKLTAAYVATRTMQQKVLGKTDGAGTTGIDEKYAAAYFEGVGAEIMGAGMFAFHTFPDDPDWQGWWGEEPPFGCPVFVLTHRERAPIEMSGGTTFHFLTTTGADALARATSVAAGKDVRIGGGASTVRDFLKEGLVDRLHVAVVPIILGRGINLWEDLRAFEDGYAVTTEVAESGVTHLTFSRD